MLRRNSKTLDPYELRTFLLNHELPGVVYGLIWSELDENSAAYAALSDVLFDCEQASHTDNAPLRDLADPKVRAGVVHCAMQYPEVTAAATKIFREIQRPWWKFW